MPKEKDGGRHQTGLIGARKLDVGADQHVSG